MDYRQVVGENLTKFGSYFPFWKRHYLYQSYYNYERLYHYYTKALWKAMPKNGFQNITIYQTNEKGCPFAQYCKKSKKQCITDEIPYFKKEESIIKCLFAGGEKQCY